ncbi:unnamed protein product [Closterium sp. Naga37s-1]|nr:unnamed protein product [Closterium sp. Naga37s-1]
MAPLRESYSAALSFWKSLGGEKSSASRRVQPLSDSTNNGHRTDAAAGCKHDATASETGAWECAAWESGASECASSETGASDPAACDCAASGAPETAALDSAAPECAAPQSAAAESAGPQSAAAESAAPLSAAAESAAPQSAAAESAAAESAAAESAAAESTATESASVALVVALSRPSAGRSMAAAATQSTMSLPPSHIPKPSNTGAAIRRMEGPTLIPRPRCAAAPRPVESWCLPCGVDGGGMVGDAAHGEWGCSAPAAAVPPAAAATPSPKWVRQAVEVEGEVGEWMAQRGEGCGEEQKGGGERAAGGEEGRMSSACGGRASGEPR